MQLKLLKSFFSETMFKGRKNALKFCTIPKENIKQLKHFYFPMQSMHLGEIEMLYLHIHISFGLMQKVQDIQSNFATLKLGITDKIISSFNAKLSQLSKTVQDLKIGHILARPTTQKRTLSCVLILFSIWCYKIRTGPPYYLAPFCIRPIRFFISTDSTDIK